MGLFLSFAGILTLIFGGYVAATSVRTDIQLILVMVSFVGGVGLISVAQVIGHTSEIVAELRRWRRLEDEAAASDAEGDDP